MAFNIKNIMTHLIVIFAIILLLTSLIAEGSLAIKVHKRGANDKIKWEKCGGNSEVNLYKLDISPDPVPLKGTINIDFDGEVKSEIEDPLKIEVKLWRKILFWIYVKGLEFENVCNTFPASCSPDWMGGKLPCGCPIKTKRYSLHNYKFKIPEFSVPDFLAKGYYSAEIKATHCGKEIFCYTLYFWLE